MWKRSLIASRDRGRRKFKGEFDFLILIFKMLNFFQLKFRGRVWEFIGGKFFIYQILLRDSLGFGMFYLREIGKCFIEKYFFYRKKKKNCSPLSTISRFYGYNMGRFIFSLSLSLFKRIEFSINIFRYFVVFSESG